MSFRAAARRDLVRGSRAWQRWRGPRGLRPPDRRPAHRDGAPVRRTTSVWAPRRPAPHGGTRSSRGIPPCTGPAASPRSCTSSTRPGRSPSSEEDAARYALHFPRPEGGVTGEWTPGYLIDFWTPGLIARAAPEARVLILLRDPLARFESALTHQLSTSRAALTQRDIQGAFQRGLYAPQLRRVLAAFPAEQVFIGQYEACRADPAAQLARTYAFLGLAPFEPDASALRGEVNPTTGRRFEPGAALRRSLLDGYAPDLEQLAELVPGPRPLALADRSRARPGLRPARTTSRASRPRRPGSAG